MRIAVVQLTTHPAITVETVDYTAEPFIDHHEPPIVASLLREETGGDIQGLRDEIRKTYLQWAENRLNGIVEWLSQIAPDIVLFSEFAIPFEHLPILKKFSHDEKCIVIAGNHAFNRRAEDYVDTLKWFPTGKNLQMPPHWVAKGACSLLVAFAPRVGNSSTEKGEGIYYRFKWRLSPQEFTAFYHENAPGTKETDPFPLNPDKAQSKIKRKQRDQERKQIYNSEEDRLLVIYKTRDQIAIKIDVMICAEALQGVSCCDDADMLYICAYHDKPEEFDHILNQTARLQKIAILASEGMYGHSAINLNYDRTFPSWWLRTAKGGRLPAGDGILVCDVPKRYTSAPRGSSNPFKEHALFRLASIVCSNKSDEHYRVHSQISKLFKGKNMERAGLDAQATLGQDIQNVLKRRKPSRLQLIKYGHLAELANLGQLSAAAIEAIVCDCVFRAS